MVKGLNLKEKRFGFEPEVTAKISRIPKVRIYEVGISYYGRTYAEGKKILNCFCYSGGFSLYALKGKATHVESVDISKTAIELVEKNLTTITGQKPVPVKARKSISGFKIREGMIVGMMVTLRGDRMYSFVDKLINVSLPRVRDFRGISPKAVDQGGNLSIGIKEYIVFPEIHMDDVQQIHGLQVIISTTAKGKEEAFKLFDLMGFPFKKK